MKNLLIVFIILSFSSCISNSNNKDSQTVASENYIPKYYRIITNRDFSPTDDIRIDFYSWRKHLLPTIPYNDIPFESLLERNILYMNINLYNDLQGKSGIFNVVAEDIEFDYYGKAKQTNKIIGYLDVDEMNKFESFNFWHDRTGGISEMVIEYFGNTPDPHKKE